MSNETILAKSTLERLRKIMNINTTGFWVQILTCDVQKCITKVLGHPPTQL